VTRQVFALGAALVFSGACGGQSKLSEGDDKPAAGETGNGGSSNGGSSNGASSNGGTSSGGTSSAIGGGTSGGASSGGASGGGASTGGVSLGGDEACAVRECGESCYVCPSNEPCEPTAYCDARRKCVTGPPPNCSPECFSAQDCPGVDVACSTCTDGSVVCPPVECARGVCRLGSVACPECQEDAECPVPPLQCETCADGTTSCPKALCYRGECQVGWSGDCFNPGPCFVLGCGDPCDPCDLPECPPLELPHFCNWEGECVTEPGCGQCKSRRDCSTPPPSCGQCPADTCWDFACIDGTCELVCH
jgi:hypothetical protein